MKILVALRQTDRHCSDNYSLQAAVTQALWHKISIDALICKNMSFKHEIICKKKKKKVNEKE